MTNIIKADLRRILEKRSVQLILVLCLGLSVFDALWDKHHFWNDFVFTVHQRNLIDGASTIFLGLVLFSAVYADAFRARSLQAIIGHGLSRPMVIAAKILDCAILTIGIYACYFVFQLVLSLATGASLDDFDRTILFFSAVCSAYVVTCCSSLAAAVLFATDNVALSVFAQLALLMIIPFVLELTGTLVFFHNNHIADYYITGFSERAFTGMVLDGSGFGTLLLGTTLYIGLAWLLTFLIFRKKELEL
ncbi:MAG: hypothetical protein IJ679_10950 [Lachnospiraceae bacterium]|nr:hypothetical protein [Lachnospiraceae bacterium]